jgi:hypothetical protein
MLKSYGDQFKEALACETKEQAEKWLLTEIEDFKGGKAEAKSTILTNIGYMAGYYGTKEQKKVYDLFGAAHQILGKPEEMTKVMPEQAFAAGQKTAKLT